MPRHDSFCKLPCSRGEVPGPRPSSQYARAVLGLEMALAIAAVCLHLIDIGMLSVWRSELELPAIADQHVHVSSVMLLSWNGSVSLMTPLFKVSEHRQDNAWSKPAVVHTSYLSCLDRFAMMLAFLAALLRAFAPVIARTIHALVTMAWAHQQASIAEKSVLLLTLQMDSILNSAVASPDTQCLRSGAL